MFVTSSAGTGTFPLGFFNRGWKVHYGDVDKECVAATTHRLGQGSIDA
jgi:hypothetical protein